MQQFCHILFEEKTFTRKQSFLWRTCFVIHVLLFRLAFELCAELMEKNRYADFSSKRRTGQIHTPNATHIFIFRFTLKHLNPSKAITILVIIYTAPYLHSCKTLAYVQIRSQNFAWRQRTPPCCHWQFKILCTASAVIIIWQVIFSWTFEPWLISRTAGKS